MKKALVLGVLAFFAINCTTVNAQDRTNVQEKGKKTYNQEPASKKEAKSTTPKTTKVVTPSTSKETPGAVKNETGSKVKGTKAGNKIQKNKKMGDAAKKNAADKPAVTAGENNLKEGVNPGAKEKAAAEAENAGTNVSKKSEQKSVPPTPKEKKSSTAKKGDNVK